MEKNPWAYIHALLGPGLHWSKSPTSIQAAIDKAEREGARAEADHLRIILKQRNDVMCDSDEEQPFVYPRKDSPESLREKIVSAFKFWWHSDARENCLKLFLIALACLIWGSWWAVPVGILVTFLWLN